MPDRFDAIRAAWHAQRNIGRMRKDEAAMTTVVTMNADGQLGLPEAIREELGIKGETLFDLELCDGAVILRPAMDIPDDIPAEDRWAYTPAHLARLRQALQESDGRQMSEADLLTLVADQTA